MVDEIIPAVCMLLCFIAVRFAAGIPFRGLKFIKNLTLLAAFIILMQMIFGPGENYAYFFKLEGLILGLVIVCRLAALFVLLPMLTETTPPSGIASGLCALGLNYRLSFIITTAFNMIPSFKDQALVIQDAQKLRGMRAFERRIFNLRAYTGLVTPLMLGAMRKAQCSSVAMDLRAFGAHKTRTWLSKPVMKGRDFVLCAVSIIFFACMIQFNYK
ncbi:MAG: energy-coupling factor transporter transmembrane protein EcfT [Treponema sp.]|nr:energy-coupling factor transporter transmembrane protein EcfT [Treponema sp.]